MHVLFFKRQFLNDLLKKKESTSIKNTSFAKFTGKHTLECVEWPKELTFQFFPFLEVFF